MSAGKSKTKRASHKATNANRDAHVKRTFLTILLSFAALLAVYFLSPNLPVEATGMFSSATTYMSPLLVLSFLFFLATLAYFFRKK